MRLTTRQLFDLGVLLALFSVTGVYLWDTWRVSSHIYNLIFVLPLTVSILILCLATFLKELVSPVQAADQATELPREESETSTLPVVLLFAAYVLTLPWLGFDVGTFVFVALFLRLAGEQKWPWALGYSLVFAFSSALFFSYMLPYPMPLLFLPGVD